MKWREIFIFHYKSKHPGYVPTSHSTVTSILSCFRFTSGHRISGCVDHNKLWKTLREMGIPNHLTCLLRNLYVGQEATVRSLYGTPDQLKIEKGTWQGCLLSPCLFDLYAEHIMRNARLDELQAGIKTGGRNINNLRYVDDTTLMTQSKDDLKSPLMRVKEESERAGLKLNIKKLRSWHLATIISWQIEREKLEEVTDFLFLGSKITADGDCSHEIRWVLLGRKAMANLDSVWKSRDITL